MPEPPPQPRPATSEVPVRIPRHRYALQTIRDYLDLVLFTAKHKLIPANRWQVFEERTFRGRRSDVPAPREAAVADVTGDGKNDLIILVHDRVIVYPQE